LLYFFEIFSFLSEIKMNNFPFKSSHILINSCDDPSFFHITLFSQSRKILFLDFRKNDQSVIENQIDKEELHSFEIVKRIEFPHSGDFLLFSKK